MRGALMFVRIHAALALCISVISFWLSYCLILNEVLTDALSGFGDWDDWVGALTRAGYTAVTPLTLSAILFMGCEIYARQDADVSSR